MAEVGAVVDEDAGAELARQNLGAVRGLQVGEELGVGQADLKLKRTQ